MPSLRTVVAAGEQVLIICAQLNGPHVPGRRSDDARRVGGKDGVAFVLRSLPENAKNLFRLLVGEALVVMEDEDGGVPGGEGVGVEYRMLYNKAVEEFICSSEMAFRTLLKE